MSTPAWPTIHENDEMLGVAGPNGESLWFISSAKEVSNDYDGPGMNHFSFGASSLADVDDAAAQLVGRGVKLLFETPRHRPEFSQSPDEPYYQIMFESPDRILCEVVYTGPTA